MSCTKQPKGDEPIIIGDNTEVIRILTDLGVLHMLEIVDGEYANEKFYHFEEPDYWCQASHYVGHDEDKDNGYMLVKIPKARMEEMSAASFFLEMMHANSLTGVTTVTFKGTPPLKHN